MAVVAAAALVSAFASAPAFGQSPPGGGGPAAGVQPAEQVPAPAVPPPAAAPARRWSLAAVASNVLESNIDRTHEGNGAGGLVIGLGAYYRNRLDRPTFTAQYQVGGHMYAGTTRWDRISHNARAAYERRLLRPLTFEVVGELSIKGSTEDRELGNQYIASPRLQYRLSRNLRLELEPGYLIKRYPDSARNATNPYAGLTLTRRFGHGRWDVEYRYEENHAESERNRYIRSTYSSELLLALAAQDTVAVELKFRPRRYQRLVRVDGERVPLRDLKWSVSPEWVHTLGPQLQLRASYEFEARDANDPERTYSAHSTVLAIERRW